MIYICKNISTNCKGNCVKCNLSSICLARIVVEFRLFLLNCISHVCESWRIRRFILLYRSNCALSEKYAQFRVHWNRETIQMCEFRHFYLQFNHCKNNIWRVQSVQKMSKVFFHCRLQWNDSSNRNKRFAYKKMNQPQQKDEKENQLLQKHQKRRCKLMNS